MNKQEEHDLETTESGESLSGKANHSDAKGTLPARQAGITHAIRRRPWIMVVVVLVAGSAVALTFLLSGGSSSQEGRPVPAPTGEAVPSPSAEMNGMRPRPDELTITLTPDKLENAQIKTEGAIEQPGAASAASGPRTTGTVQSNAYKEVPVLPVAGGIVREVNTQLGDKVGRGQALASIFSTELANAQGDYIRMLAELDEHHKHHQRAIELVEIGAMSREDLEKAGSMYKAAEANVSSARQRLILLGMSAKQVDDLRNSNQVHSLISVPAPTAGTVISRTVNTGEVVATGKELFRVADLSTVWVIGQIYENDFAKVRVGTPATITTMAYPGRTFSGRVSYIDPRVDSNTRTAQVRIEVPNPGEMLKIGMFVDVGFGGASPAPGGGQPVALVPRAAVQSIGTKQVVFVATDKPGVFVQREVTIGPEGNGLVPIYGGVSAGDRVVTEGSFLLRAESLKLNPGQSTSSNAEPAHKTFDSRRNEPAQPRQPTESPSAANEIQTVNIAVTKDGFTPSSFTVRKNIPLRLTFVRKVEVTCATDVVIPDYEIKRELPLDEPVVVEFTPEKAGTISFACGMNMQRGKIIVK